LFNFVAAGLWAGVLLSAGHAYGHLSEKVMNDAFSGLGMVMLAVFLVLSWILSRKLERIVERS
jgi:membrane protein DedA with SNARE-associated domain